MSMFIQAQLCDSLERIADDLPDNVDRRLCRKVIDTLQFEMPLHHRDEELGLFPLIEKRALPNDNIHDILACHALEHATDESFADELLESLEGLSEGRKLKNPTWLAICSANSSRVIVGTLFGKTRLS
jgi:hemerythrin-like domain-containing protein